MMYLGMACYYYGQGADASEQGRYSQKDIHEAAEWLEGAAARMRHLKATADPDYARTLYILALCEREAGRCPNAASLHRESLKIVREAIINGTAGDEIAASYGGTLVEYADTLNRMGRFREAESLCNEALGWCIAKNGNVFEALNALLVPLADSYIGQGRRAEADETHSLASALLARPYLQANEAIPSAAQSENGPMGSQDLAGAVIRPSLIRVAPTTADPQFSFVGEGHIEPDGLDRERETLLGSRDDLLGMHRECCLLQGDLIQARDSQRQFACAYFSRFGNYDRRTIEANAFLSELDRAADLLPEKRRAFLDGFRLFGRAHSLLEAGDVAAAREPARKCLDRFQGSVGCEGPYVATAMIMLGSAQILGEKARWQMHPDSYTPGAELAEGEQWLGRGMAAYRKLKLETHGNYGNAQYSLALSEFLHRDYDKAMLHCIEAMSTLASTFGEGDWRWAAAVSNYAMTLNKLGRFPKAEAQCKDAEIALLRRNAGLVRTVSVGLAELGASYYGRHMRAEGGAAFAHEEAIAPHVFRDSVLGNRLQSIRKEAVARAAEDDKGAGSH
jgi:tetratricopeptide (TPR) repeat protein